MHPDNPRNPQYHDDEISLLDLWRTLARHRLLIAGVFAAALLAAGAYLLLRFSSVGYDAM